MERFSHSARHVDDLVVVTAYGDIDLAASDRLVEAVRPYLVTGRVVLDCARITFLDSAGLRALVQLQREAAALGSGFALSEMSDPVRRVLDLSGTTDRFAVAHGVAAGAASDAGADGVPKPRAEPSG